MSQGDPGRGSSPAQQSSCRRKNVIPVAFTSTVYICTFTIARKYRTACTLYNVHILYSYSRVERFWSF